MSCEPSSWGKCLERNFFSYPLTVAFKRHNSRFREHLCRQKRQLLQTSKRSEKFVEGLKRYLYAARPYFLIEQIIFFQTNPYKFVSTPWSCHRGAQILQQERHNTDQRLQGQIHHPKEVRLPVITRIQASCQIIRNKFTNIISHLIEFAVHLYLLRRINSLAIKAIA